MPNFRIGSSRDKTAVQDWFPDCRNTTVKGTEGVKFQKGEVPEIRQQSRTGFQTAEVLQLSEVGELICTKMFFRQPTKTFPAPDK